MNKFILASLKVLVASLVPFGIAGANPVELKGPEEVKSAVVLVTAKGVSTVLGNVEVATQSTGFFTSKDGFLVTAYHLLDDLVKKQQADIRTVTYEIRFANGDTLPASKVTGQPEVDMLILMAQISERDVHVLAPAYRSKEKIVPGITKVYTAGFPSGYQFSVDSGIIKSWGPNAPVLVWATNLNFKDGQSGSPILLENNTVIAYAKADDANASTIGLVVPISVVPSNYWDAAHDNWSKSLAAAISSSRTGVLPTFLVSSNEKPDVTREKSAPIGLTNSHCAGANTHTISIGADSGWEIDPTSIQIHPTAIAGNSSAMVTGQSPTNVDVTISAMNIGRCVQALGTTVASDLNGSFTGYLSYREVPTAAAKEQPVTVAEIAAVPGSNSQIMTSRKPGDLSFKLLAPSGVTESFTPKAGELMAVPGGLTLDTGKILTRLQGLRDSS